ncbi:MAG TPA: HAMP domain-containing sensor histidine kinase [Chryseolinea sp.]|nr:HAMP domain-containing sensor histidine kinase [Chryseolinea sp.]
MPRTGYDITFNFDDETHRRFVSPSKMGNQRSSTHFVRLALMVSSIALLMLLQSFWLANSYEQSFLGFRRETSALLRSTVFSLRDSLFQSDVVQGLVVRNDLTPDNGKLAGQKRKITIVRKSDGRVAWTDSSLLSGIVDRPIDSVLRQRNFVIHIRPEDTLSMDALREQYDVVIAHAGYPYRFTIRHLIREPNDTSPMAPLDFPAFEPLVKGKLLRLNAFGDTLVTERVPMGPIHAYAAVFPAMRANILRKIAPQILFSGFLTIITIAAFVVMYRNLRSQERLMEMKNDFISNVTHELKTPIATVSVALEALKDFHALKNPIRTAEYLGIAQHELNRLSLMTDKILKASAFEQQGVTFIPGVVKLDEIVRQVVESLTVILEKKHLTAATHLDGEYFEIEGSDMHMINVVYNLLDNAIKYSPDHKTIKIDLKGAENEVILTVHDEGLGIDPIHHKRIFEKFFRVPSGDVHNTRGYGLGLNYVADVVRSHHGTVTVQSQLGAGSCFILQLPRKHGH